MRACLWLGLALAGLMLLPGCRPAERKEAGAAPGAGDGVPHPLDHAQPRLATIKLWLGDQELLAEVARTTTQLQTGMMYRTNMAPNEAMLFVFGGTFRASFYMRNTTVPLTAAYIDPSGAILELHDLVPREERPVEAATDQVQYVLETPQGWFKQHNLGVGAVVRTQYGALPDIDWTTLRPRRGRPAP